jgi:hypothetical protein
MNVNTHTHAYFVCYASSFSLDMLFVRKTSNDALPSPSHHTNYTEHVLVQYLHSQQPHNKYLLPAALTLESKSLLPIVESN